MSEPTSLLPLLLEPEDFQHRLDTPGMLIVDVSRDEVYAQLHLPGAVHLSPAQLVGGKPPATGKLPDPETLRDNLQGIGLTPETHVVAYDDEGGGWAGRLIWTLDVIGHHKYSYLNGGLRAWLDEGFPVEQARPEVAASRLDIRIDNGPIADREYLLKKIGDPDLAIWDARSPGEFSGERLTARRAGHIPGARNYEWTRAMDPQRGCRLRDMDAIRAELEELGLTPDREIVTHCQTHHRSGFTYLLAKLLHYPRVKAYPGSWSEWGNDPDTPIETTQ